MREKDLVWFEDDRRTVCHLWINHPLWVKEGDGMTIRRWSITTWLVVVSGIVSLLVAGCGSDPTPTPRPTPMAQATVTPSPTATPLPPGATAVATPTSAPTPTPDESFEARWRELIVKAQEEGEVHFHRAITDQLPILQLFEDKFGIRTVPGTAGGRASTDRVLAERSRGRYTVDISNAGAGSSDRLVAAGALVPIVPEIFHPEAFDASNWLGTPPHYADRDESYLLAWSFSITDLISVWYNANEVSPEEADSIQSHWDLLTPEWRGKVAIQDPAAAGRSDLRVREWQVLGREFMDTLIRSLDRDAIYPATGREASEALARGKFSWLVFASTNDVEELEAIGQPITSLSKKGHLEGGLMAEAGAGTSKRGIFDRAANPNAARLFSNWFLTREGQTAWNELRDPPDPIDQPSLRTDVPQGLVSDGVWARTKALGDLPVRKPDATYYKALDESQEFVNALYEELGFVF